jgi:hypothetical protein
MKIIIVVSILVTVVLLIIKFIINKTKALVYNDIIYLDAFVNNCELTKENYSFIMSEFVRLNGDHNKNNIRISQAYSVFRNRFDGEPPKFVEQELNYSDICKIW